MVIGGFVQAVGPALEPSCGADLRLDAAANMSFAPNMGLGGGKRDIAKALSNIARGWAIAETTS